jgi:hypothetical protein
MEYKTEEAFYISDILRFIKEVYHDNNTVKRVCNIILLIIALLSIVGSITFVGTLVQNAEKAKLASTHYSYWLEQLSPEHPLKQDRDGLGALYELQSAFGIVAGALIDSQEEIIKSEFSKLDITELGILDAYLSRKLDETKPEYLLIDAKTMKTLKTIKIAEGGTTSIKLYRNGEEIFFDYILPENMWRNNKRLELHKLISLGFVKAYIQNPDIAKINSNQITAINKGKTKLILIYGTQLLEKEIVIN